MKTNTLSNWLENWVDVYKLHTVKLPTYQMYQYAIGLVGKHDIGSVRMKRITVEQLQNFLNDLAANEYSKSTINKAKITLSRSILTANKSGLLSRKLETFSRDDLIVPNAPTKEVKALTVLEQEKVIQALTGTIHEKAFLFLFHTGVRKAELMELKRSDYDLASNTIKIQKSKTNSGIRTIPLSRHAKEIIKFQLSLPKETPYIFNNSKGKQLKKSTIDKAVKKVREVSGVESFACHVCRHTFATRAIERGMNVKALSAVLGHRDVGFTMRQYVHADDKFIRDEMEKLN
jgi:Site-specific recombinase XerD